MIQLIGPGGAGKSTSGEALAKRLHTRFVDLDTEFAARHGNISAYLDTHGYEAYAKQNVCLYLELIASLAPSDVIALSSGFMTYPHQIHPDYRVIHQQIVSSPSTFVLLPSLDFETCVREIVRRQQKRPFARSPEREEHVIRERFFIYFELPAYKVATLRPVELVVDDLVLECQKTKEHSPCPMSW